MDAILTLRALTGDLRGQEFSFHGPAHCVLGRSRSCQLRLPGDASVSRQHCLIELEGESAWVQDLGSLNGTHLNGEKIGQRQGERQADATMVAPLRQQLQDGDELRICNNSFAVVLSDRPAEHVGPGKHEEAIPRVDRGLDWSRCWPSPRSSGASGSTPGLLQEGGEVGAGA
jgi:pSer/pThr/pTyr-binding forkhead associated (FHA) protein